MVLLGITVDLMQQIFRHSDIYSLSFNFEFGKINIYQEPDASLIFGASSQLL